MPYIRRFVGKTVVVKYGGSFMDSPDEQVRNSVARDVVFLVPFGLDAALPFFSAINTLPCVDSAVRVYRRAHPAASRAWL